MASLGVRSAGKARSSGSAPGCSSRKKRACGCVRDSRLEGCGRRDFGDAKTPRLLAALPRDLFPAIDAFGRGSGQAFFGAISVYRNDARNPQLGSFFHQPLKAIELDERGENGDFG